MEAREMSAHDKAYICEQSEIAYGTTLVKTSPLVMSPLDVHPTAVSQLLILWRED